MEWPETGVSEPRRGLPKARGSVRLEAGAPKPTRPGGKTQARDKFEKTGEMVLAPLGVNVALVLAAITKEGGKRKIHGVVRPIPGQPELIYTNIHPWQDALFQKEMKQHRCDNSKWKAGPITEGMGSRENSRC